MMTNQQTARRKKNTNKGIREMSSRTPLLVGLAVLVALGLFFVLDPTLGGLLKRRHHHHREGFQNSGGVTHSGAAYSMNGEPAGALINAGQVDVARIMNASQNATPQHTTVSPDTPDNAPVREGFESPSPMPFAAASTPSNCYPKNQLAPQELLPNDPNSKWAQVNPQGAGDIAGKNFLNAGALIGVNTVGQSLRNASWDLRSEPPNPQVNVSPWLNSTISPDTNRRVLEIA